jgi:hypothetical protein
VRRLVVWLIASKYGMDPSQTFPRPVLLAGSPVTAGTLSRLAVYIVLCAFALSPLLWVRVPPLADYPNHLARMWILVHGLEIPDLLANYQIHWRVLPDLAMDLVVSMLSPVLSVEDAGRAFVALTMALLVAGTAALHRVLHGRVGLWPLASLLFLYNASLFWGFLNSLFATAVYLFAFAGWIVTRNARPGPRILAFSAVATTLFSLHLFGFGLYGLSVVSYEVGIRLEGRRLRLRSLRPLLAISLQFVPAVVLWHVSRQHAGSTLIDYGALSYKLYALVAPVTFHARCFPLDAALWLIIVLFVIYAGRRGMLRVAPEMRIPLSAMAVAAIAMPHVVSGSWLADIRLPVALPFVALAATRLDLPPRRAFAVALAGFAMLAVRVWVVSQSWADYNRWFGEFRTAAAAIAPGARLAVVAEPIPPERQTLRGLPAVMGTAEDAVFQHLPLLAVIDRAVFLPYIFTGWTTVDVAPRNAAISQPAGGPMTPAELVKTADPETANSLVAVPNMLGQLPYWRNWTQTFDYLLWMDFGGAPHPRPDRLQLVVSGSFFEIYKITRP